MDLPEIVDAERWKVARAELLEQEKDLTHRRDRLAAARRRMPRMRVEDRYRFDGPSGETDLLGMFGGRRQLIVYRFFFEQGVDGWPEGGCPGCSWVADQMTHPAHLAARDTTLAIVSRAPQERISALRSRMGWPHLENWYTLTDDFDRDVDVDLWHGTNVFLREGDEMFRTYFVDGRGDEALGGLWAYLDITPLGRQEDWQDVPDGYPQDPGSNWVHRHDEYA